MEKLITITTALDKQIASFYNPSVARHVDLVVPRGQKTPIEVEEWLKLRLARYLAKDNKKIKIVYK
jgi:type 1 glutamine amidotransferase